jgi:hypothetical protein
MMGQLFCNKSLGILQSYICQAHCLSHWQDDANQDCTYNDVDFSYHSLGSPVLCISAPGKVLSLFLSFACLFLYLSDTLLLPVAKLHTSVLCFYFILPQKLKVMTPVV